MPDDPDTDALERFARDLRRIRENREVALARIEEATQIRQSHLQSFEDGTLHEKSKMNPVYLRAFVRAYAEALGLPPDPVVDHLEASLSGDYQNELSVQYLKVPPSKAGEEGPSARPGTSPREKREAPSPPDESSPQGSSQSTASDRSPDAAESGDAPEDSSPQGSQETEGSSPDVDGAEDLSEEVPTDKGERPTASSSAGFPESRPDAGSTVSATTTDPSGPDSRDRRSATTSSFAERWSDLWPPRRGVLIVAAIGLVLVVLLLGGGLGLFRGDSEPTAAPTLQSEASAPAQSSAPDLPADTVGQDTTSEQRPLADMTLGDTLYVTVLATSDVRGIRVQQDDSLRRPYWIREGEAMVFPFARRITLQNQLDSLRLLLDQYPYPSRTDDEGRIVITRDAAEQYADTLRGSPVPVPGSPDTVLGTAPPTESGS